MANYTNRGVMWLSTFLVFLGFADAIGAEEYLSPLALVPDRDERNLYVAEATAKRVAVFDIESGKVTQVIALPGHPGGLAISPDQPHLYVTCASVAGKVCVIDLNTKSITDSIPVGHTPGAIVVSPNGKTLYVCNRFNNNISVIDLSAQKEVVKIPVAREPSAAAITPNGKLLFVTNLLPTGVANRDYTAAVVSVIDTTSRKLTSAIQLPNGSIALRGVCISPDGRHAYVTHTLARYQLPTTQLERGWMNTNALSIIDVTTQSLVNTVLLDDIDLGTANPWGVSCTPDGKYICVTHAGTHEVSIINRAGLHEKLAETPASKSDSYTSLPQDVPNNLAFLVGLRRRVKLIGDGPRGLAIIGTKVYVAEYFTDSLGIFDIAVQLPSETKSLPLGPKKPPTTVRKGEMFFHDARLCFQHWQSCTSCHPSQGRPDALNWDLLNDGMGNPKNTKSLLLSHRTPPAMITGVRGKAETAVRTGIKHILFTVQPEEHAEAIDEYLKSLKPVPSPYLAKGQLNEAAKRGRKIFKEAGCARCHPAPLYTDMNKYDVGTGKNTEKNRPFDTPTLVEVWRSAPYLLDGRAATIKEILTKYNPGDKHGTTSNLSEKQINDLAKFVLSL